MAWGDESDGCPKGLCHCGCANNPCKPCPVPSETPVAVNGEAMVWAWCIPRPGARTVCWPWQSGIPVEALRYAAERLTAPPVPMGVSDVAGVEWATPLPTP